MISRKDNLQNISEAFKRLFEKVSARMHSSSLKAHVVHRSFSVHKNEEFLKRRKNSISYSHRRKNSFFSQNSPESPNSNLNTQSFSFNQSSISKSPNKNNRLLLTSYNIVPP